MEKSWPLELPTRQHWGVQRILTFFPKLLAGEKTVIFSFGVSFLGISQLLEKHLEASWNGGYVGEFFQRKIQFLEGHLHSYGNPKSTKNPRKVRISARNLSANRSGSGRLWYCRCACRWTAAPRISPGEIPWGYHGVYHAIPPEFAMKIEENSDHQPSSTTKSGCLKVRMIFITPDLSFRMKSGFLSLSASHLFHQTWCGSLKAKVHKL